MTGIDLVKIVEGALMAAGKPLTVVHIAELFEEHERPETTAIREALKEVELRCEDRGFELWEVSGGFRFQVRQSLSPWVARLWHERPQKYSRAMLETLSLIAYRQPITRGEIEEIRGVAVSSSIVKTLHEREWIRVVGHRDVPGRPAMYATTRQFLDYFNLKTLDQLPALAEIRDFDTLTAELGFADLEENPAVQEELGEDGDTSELETTESDNNDENVTGITVELDLEPATQSESTAGAALAVVGGTEYATEDADADARQQHSSEPGQ
jgi:segregation and condensation protein B